MASEGPTAEELEALEDVMAEDSSLDFQPETEHDIGVGEEVTAMQEFLVEESETLQELIAEAQADAPIENATNDVDEASLPSANFNAPHANGEAAVPTPAREFPTSPIEVDLGNSFNTPRLRFHVPIHIGYGSRCRWRERERYRERQCEEANICRHTE
ncbi:hypothetical protein PR002_g29767 [Phytophthora rubi]|uniref:Uncharacterized protein n=2 Tax=Phytophthora rubi TaxID=129364 RepID=A0A6A3GYG2_9STRA|nr:hypothetical protein PR002_g29767 [Phytophthora rubi]